MNIDKSLQKDYTLFPHVENISRSVIVAEKDKVYKCLNPVGIQAAIDTFPLAPRLKNFDGKTIYFSICGEPDITIPLEKRLKNDYPNVNWKVKKTYGTTPVEISDEEMKTTDALIQGVAW